MMRNFVALALFAVFAIFAASGCRNSHRYVSGGLGGVGGLSVILGATTLQTCSGREGCSEKNGPQVVMIAGGAGLLLAAGVVLYVGETADDGAEGSDTHTIFDGSEEE